MKEKQNYWYDADQIEQIAIRIKKRDESAWLEFMEITKQRYYCIALDALNHNDLNYLSVLLTLSLSDSNKLLA